MPRRPSHDELTPGADVLSAAREELTRADAKATTLLASSGVAIGVVLSGLVSGQWSPVRIPGGFAQTVWWAGAGAFGAALLCLTAAMYPRTRRRERDSRLAAYFGDVVLLGTDELRRAFRGGARAARARTLDQLQELSRIAHRKYALIKAAIWLLSAAVMLCLGAVVLGVLLPLP